MATATAGWPWTAACSPKRMHFPGARRHLRQGLIHGLNTGSGLYSLLRSEGFRCSFDGALKVRLGLERAAPAGGTVENMEHPLFMDYGPLPGSVILHSCLRSPEGSSATKGKASASCSRKAENRFDNWCSDCRGTQRLVGSEKSPQRPWLAAFTSSCSGVS